jgi:hypothetical protein
VGSRDEDTFVVEADDARGFVRVVMGLSPTSLTSSVGVDGDDGGRRRRGEVRRRCVEVTVIRLARGRGDDRHRESVLLEVTGHAQRTTLSTTSTLTLIDTGSLLGLGSAWLTCDLVMLWLAVCLLGPPLPSSHVLSIPARLCFPTDTRPNPSLPRLPSSRPLTSSKTSPPHGTFAHQPQCTLPPLLQY